MKREILTITEGLNTAQKQAVEEFEGPSLIIAGAGSGKTRVLTCRIANILDHGHRASSVLALTFTNKASKEMKERIASLVGKENARWLWMGTFHSVFIRFLREDAQLLGFPSAFTIYDTSDSKSAIRSCIRDLNLDEKLYKPGVVLGRISMAKNNLVTASAYANNGTLVQNDAAARMPRIADIYALYEKRCRQSGAMDFDDILLYTNILLRDFPEVLDKLRSRFSYILVDEYQDTNFAQYLIVKKLSSIHRNLCVVGDDAQSIYAFRGARIENILNFRKDYPEAKEFRLEQNYRSTQIIVKAANSLISKNANQLRKECFSEVGGGDKIEVVKAYTDQEEAFLVASSIVSRIYSDKSPYSEFAVLYRTNAQSRAIEEALRKRSLPYRIYGGNSFYDRAEVKDVVAYLRLLVNPKDDEAFRRVVNVPARGIGTTSLGYLASASTGAGVSLWEAVTSFVAGSAGHPDLPAHGLKNAAINKFAEFCNMLAQVREKVGVVNAYDVAIEIFIMSGYATMLKSDNSIEGQARAENVEELFNSIKSFVEEAEAEAELYEPMQQEGGSLTGEDSLLQDSLQQESLPGQDVALLDVRPSVLLGDFLETISLMSAVDDNSQEDDTNKVTLMTVHSAKGLEFGHVYIIGLEENLFPSINSSSSENEIEEERRLMYVALTRAKKSVTISYAQTRFRWGTHVNYPPSRFLREIDKEFLNWPDLESADSPFSASSWGKGASLPRESGSYRGQSPSRENGSSASAAPFTRKPQFTPPKPPNPNFQADPVSKLKEGQKVEHDRFGFGTLLKIEGDPLNLKAIVEFEQGGRKILLLKFAKLRVIE
jgi:DNA helicase-2/ATP-dependent DNA helicase PcrA